MGRIISRLLMNSRGSDVAMASEKPIDRLFCIFDLVRGIIVEGPVVFRNQTKDVERQGSTLREMLDWGCGESCEGRLMRGGGEACRFLCFRFLKVLSLGVA